MIPATMEVLSSGVRSIVQKLALRVCMDSQGNNAGVGFPPESTSKARAQDMYDHRGRGNNYVRTGRDVPGLDREGPQGLLLRALALSPSSTQRRFESGKCRQLTPRMGGNKVTRTPGASDFIWHDEAMRI